jgi:hypothetical protein
MLSGALSHPWREACIPPGRGYFSEIPTRPDATSVQTSTSSVAPTPAARLPRGESVKRGELPPEVARFIAEHIDAAEQLEILLLLHREPEREWTALDVSQAIYTVPASATLRLEGLAASGFVASTGGGDPRYRFAPRSEALRAQVDVLAEAYRADRVAVIKLIFSRPPDPVQSFADAFRLRGKGS